MVNFILRNSIWHHLPRTRALVLLYCSVILLFIGWLDIVTGDYSLIIFYMIPVALAAWFISKRSGVLFCLLSIVVRIAADEISSTAIFTHSMLHYWNELVELLFLLIMSLLFSALHKNLEKEKELARKDPLTKAHNRRSFFDLGEHEIHRSQRYHLPLTAAYIDLDNFKAVNDTFGHKTGDELLVTVVSTIRSHLRSSDIFARFGGDEFVILLPDTPGDSAVTFLNKLQVSLDRAMAQHNWPVGFSIGAATYEQAPPTIEEVIRCTDQLMYAAKNSGKNRLIHKEIGVKADG